jgi:hypothetical protein
MKKLPERIENILIPLISINQKMVLGGSLCLHLLDIMDIDFEKRPSDLDISLSDKLTVEELLIIKDFFNLNIRYRYTDYSKSYRDKIEFIKRDISKVLKRELVQLFNEKIKIDIFNTDLKNDDIFTFDYEGLKIKMVYPSIILSHKSKYAYDPRVGASRKHFYDLQRINWEKYFIICNNNIQYDYDQLGETFNLQYKPNPKNNENSSMWNNVSRENQPGDLPF